MAKETIKKDVYLGLERYNLKWLHANIGISFLMAFLSWVVLGAGHGSVVSVIITLVLYAIPILVNIYYFVQIGVVLNSDVETYKKAYYLQYNQNIKLDYAKKRVKKLKRQFRFLKFSSILNFIALIVLLVASVRHSNFVMYASSWIYVYLLIINISYQLISNNKNKLLLTKNNYEIFSKE